MAERVPALFVAHGVPTLPIEDCFIIASARRAERNHAIEKHYLQIFAAAGAGTEAIAGRRMHRGHAFGGMAMDICRFD